MAKVYAAKWWTRFLCAPAVREPEVKPGIYGRCAFEIKAASLKAFRFSCLLIKAHSSVVECPGQTAHFIHEAVTGSIAVTGFSGKQIAVSDKERHIHFQRVIAKIFLPEKFTCCLFQFRLFPSVGIEGLPQRRNGRIFIDCQYCHFATWTEYTTIFSFRQGCSRRIN